MRNMAYIIQAVTLLLSLATQINGQPATLRVTATNSIESLHLDSQLQPIGNLPNRSEWSVPDSVPLGTYTRLVAIRASNRLGGCSGFMVAAVDSPLEYEFVSDRQWKCATAAPNGWELLGFDDSSWTAAVEIARNGDIVTGCPWFIIQSMPTEAFWIWTEAHLDGDQVISCRGYTPVCDAMPCQNGATCQINSAALCNCPVRWTGQFCETQFDECESDPCQNGGQCQLDDQGYVCECNINFTGTNCEIDISPCASQPCENDGTCIFDSDGGYTCSCAPGFSGLDCEINIDECASDPCENGATCIDGVNGFTCACAPGFTGTFCGNNIDECLSNPCLNAATCEDRVNGYVCTCHPGYTGTLCETGVGNCASNPCLNGGTCTLGGPGGALECICAPGWLGAFCGTNEDDCLSQPCQNGGTCIDGESEYECQCTPIYTGPTCAEVIPNCGDIMDRSEYPPANNFWILCQINIGDHPNHLNTPCRDLIVGINHYNDSSTIVSMGGNFGCYPTRFPDEVNSACYNNYNQDRTLNSCLSCTVMGVCIRVP